MHDDLFFELIQNLDGHFDANAGDLVPLLNALKEKYELSHVAYLGVNLPTFEGDGTDEAFIVTTYSDNWVSRYVSQSYVRIDPVIRAGLRGILPIDWADLPGRTDRKVISMFNEAGEHGVGPEGVSIPIHGVHGETAMFSVNSKAPKEEWLRLRRSILRELQIVAYHFHTRVLELKGTPSPEEIMLSDRERECLKWAAAGKSAWETGSILGIRETTVTFFLEQCRTKLAAANKVQAVAKAVRLSLI